MKSLITIVVDFIANLWMLLAIIGLVIDNKVFTLSFIICYYSTKTICNCLMALILLEKGNDKKNSTDNS